MRAACTVLVLALAVPPLAGQAKVTGGAAGSAVVAPIDESKTLLAGSESTAAPGGTSDAAGGAAAAPGGAAAAGAPTTGGGVSTWDFVRMLLILAAVVAVIYVLFWLLRKGTRGRIQENDLIKVLGSRGLSGSRALHLVEVGSSIYLVGSADGGVQLIAEITDKESIDSVRLKSAEGAPGGKRTFAQILSEIFRPAKRTFSVGEGIGLLKGQRDRLKRL